MRDTVRYGSPAPLCLLLLCNRQPAAARRSQQLKDLDKAPPQTIGDITTDVGPHLSGTRLGASPCLRLGDHSSIHRSREFEPPLSAKRGKSLGLQVELLMPRTSTHIAESN